MASRSDQPPGGNDKPADKVTTTITLPKQTADDVKLAAARAGVGWTQMMAVLIRQALDAQAPKP